MAIPNELNPDVRLAFETLKAKRPIYDQLYNYYLGRHPLKYSASRLKKVFQKLDAYIAQNWIGVIISSVLDRLNIKGFDVTDNQTADDKLDAIWSEYNLQLIADDVHESAEITGEGYIVALPSDEPVEDTATLPKRVVKQIKKALGVSTEPQNKYDIYFNDARMCHVFYDPDQPNKKRMAAKLYTGKEGYMCLVLYYSDHFEYYISNSKVRRGELSITFANFQLDPEFPEEPNEYGIIPVFHFVIARASGKKPIGLSEISAQDMINKLLSDMLASAEFSTFVQRVIISQADPGELQNIAGANWWIPAGDGKGQQASVQELGGRPLAPFLEAIDQMVVSLAITSNTPKHYFFIQGGEPSGEALQAQESPLVKKVKKRIEIYSVEWKNFALYLLLLEGIKNVKGSQIISTWDRPEQLSAAAAAAVIQAETSAGIPLVTSITRLGWAKDEIEQLEKDKAEEKKGMSGLAQDALDKLRAEIAQKNTTPDISMANSDGNG